MRSSRTSPSSPRCFISLLYTIVGNLSDLSHARPQLDRTFARVDTLLDLEPWVRRLGAIGEGLARFLEHAAKFGVEAAITVLEPFADVMGRDIPTIFPRLLEAFITLDSDKDSDQRDQPQQFQDYGREGLPMDNGADDQLVPHRVLRGLVAVGARTAGHGDPAHVLHRARGRPRGVPADRLYAWELYAAKPTPMWMAASHTSGADEWRDGVLRIDPYWFAVNPGDPAQRSIPRSGS